MTLHRSPISIDAPAAQLIAREIKRIDKVTLASLADHIDLPYTTISSLVSAMHKQGRIHISGWLHSEKGVPKKMYTWGEGKDAPASMRAQKPKTKQSDTGLPWPRCDVAASWIL
jgi:hypothetical protein